MKREKTKRQDFLTDLQFCHVINTRTGKLTIVNGPRSLKYMGIFYKIHGDIKKKIVVNEDEYAVVMNPFDRNGKKQLSGQWELRRGPATFSLHPGEVLWNIDSSKDSSSIGKPIQVMTLKSGEYVVIMNPVNTDGIGGKALIDYGNYKVITGPASYIVLPGEYIWKKDVQNVQYLKAGQYVIIQNYIGENGTIKYGKQKTISGPATYMPLPEEKYLLVTSTIVLEKGEGIHVKAILDFKDGETSRKAGDKWLIEGPASYLPPEEAEVMKEHVHEIILNDHSGVYIEDIVTGNVRLERGPKTIMLKPDEKLWKKEYTQSEVEAIWRVLGVQEKSERIREKRFNVDEVINFNRWEAQPLWVLENEAMKIMSQDEQSRIVFGPKVILLEPHERPFVMTIAGGTPKTKRLRIWKIKLGPNFSTDIITVRTNDNAELNIKVRYEWKFIVDKDDVASAQKIFSVPDFIGLAVETMGSKIRDIAAKHTFEELHAKCLEILRKAVFENDDATSFDFDNGFHVFGFDVREIKPQDAEIAKKMAEAIKSNMQIYVDKVKLEADLTAKKLEAERSREIELARRALIEAEQENKKLEVISKARSEAEARMIVAQSEADAIRVKKIAEAEGDIEKIKKTGEVLEDMDKQFDHYVTLMKIDALRSVEKMIVPEGSSSIISIADLLPSRKRE